MLTFDLLRVKTRHNLIAELTDRCRDPDRNTRKFACFAIGNAGFHNAELYEALRPCIPALIELLNDVEEKTRANAAGALGNLVRNSDLLCTDLVAHGAIERLLHTVMEDDGQTQSARKIALFSLGNFCTYPECRTILLERYSFLDIVAKLSTQPDPTVQKYVARIRQKLGGSSSSSVSTPSASASVGGGDTTVSADT